MKLKEDIKRGVDYNIINLSVWSKLVHTFGGAPEINIFLITKEGGSTESGNEKPDIKPIKVDVKSLDFGSE
jgi:hypothetical protein